MKYSIGWKGFGKEGEACIGSAWSIRAWNSVKLCAILCPQITEPLGGARLQLVLETSFLAPPGVTVKCKVNKLFIGWESGNLMLRLLLAGVHGGAQSRAWALYVFSESVVTLAAPAFSLVLFLLFFLFCLAFLRGPSLSSYVFLFIQSSTKIQCLPMRFLSRWVPVLSYSTNTKHVGDRTREDKTMSTYSHPRFVLPHHPLLPLRLCVFLRLRLLFVLFSGLKRYLSAGAGHPHVMPLVDACITRWLMIHSLSPSLILWYIPLLCFVWCDTMRWVARINSVISCSRCWV